MPGVKRLVVARSCAAVIDVAADNNGTRYEADGTDPST